MSTEYVWVKKNTEWKVYEAAKHVRKALTLELAGWFGVMAALGIAGSQLI